MNRDNPYRPSSEQDGVPTKREVPPRRVASMIAVLAFGVFSGVVVAITAIVLGFHGNHAVAALYMLGPTIWGVVALTSNDTEYLVTVLVGSVLLLTGYSYIVAHSRWSSWKLRLALVVIFHFLGGITYHMTVGI